jgi:hypothetical protein
MAKEKKAFKDTLFGKIVGKAGNIIPDVIGIAAKVVSGDIAGALDEVKHHLTNSNDPASEGLLNELTLQRYQIMLELARVELEEFKIGEENITARWVADSNSESWLSKNIRPLVVANFTLLIDFVLIASQFGKPIAEAYLPILMTMGVTAIGGYFTLREYGKRKK